MIKGQHLVTVDKIEQYFSERLRAIFKPDKIGSLTATGSDGKSRVAATTFGSLSFPAMNAANATIIDETTWQLSFSNRSQDHVVPERVVIEDLQELLSKNALYGNGLYLPSKEMVSFFEGFLAAYEKRELQFDETYKDLALHLSASKLKEPPAFIQQELKALTADMGGTLKLAGGKFYLMASKSKPKEITLVAEGIRKIATLLYLLENGSLAVGDTLYWD